MNTKPTYWGILCWTSSEPVTFETPGRQQFELANEYVRPGKILCAQGDYHAHLPRDFRFFSIAAGAPKSGMQVDRDAYRTISLYA
jgi:hypothetical protein